MDLFSAAGLQPIAIEDGELALLPQLPMALSNAAIFERLLSETAWRQDTIVVFGKRHLQPRLSAWYGEAAYTYSGLRLEPLPMTPLLAQLRAAVEGASGQRFNSVLLNLYRDGRDSMGMHSDDEPELGPRPVIASLSYGATRHFILRHKRGRGRLKLALGDGNLLLMAGALQANWQHGINKTNSPVAARLNLTFRNIL